MLSPSTWLHLRIPFSFYLLPVFLFSLAISPAINAYQVFMVFITLHLFLYPASNGYNSYFDKDEKSIGGLKNPPKVRHGLYIMSLLFDAIAIILGWLLSWQYALMLFIYGLVSKAYSHPTIRLKKYPYLSWLIAGFFQGAFTFGMAYIGLNHLGFIALANTTVVIPAILSSLILWGSYPMTQIYQHEEDLKRNDITLSYILGIRRTFYFTAIVFTAAVAAYWWYFVSNYNFHYALLFLAFMIPVLIYFSWWFLQVVKDESNADYAHTMRLNYISSLCLNIFFVYLFVENNQLF
jgi:1,4-dihydroxy-2-naphthoate octaprenyltransferase